MRTLSDEQQKIMAINDINILVNASAGSGKTTVMVSKIIDYITNGVDIENILAVTFTVKAAGELKERLISELTQSGDKKLFMQADKVSSADIGTLHSFCQKILKKFFYKAQLSSSFEIVDEDDANYIKFNALQKVIDVESEQPNFYKIIAFFKDRKSTDNLKKCILEIYEFINSFPNYDYLDKVAFAGYESNLNKNIVCHYINNKFNSNMQRYKNLFAELNYKINIDNNQVLIDFCNKLLDKLEQFTNKNTYENNINAFELLDLPRFVGKNFEGQTQVLKEELKQVWDKFNKFLKSYKDFYIDKQILLDQLKNASCYLQIIIDILKKFINAYEQEKKEKNVLDFNDLEKYTILLLDDKEVAEQIRSQYKYICVDEYQDINEVQEKILQAISNNNLLMVGDTKQSIYGFRNSSPEIFSKKAKLYKNNDGGQVIPLLTNYRSSKEILNFANDLFKTIMTEISCDVDYLDDAMFKPNDNREDDEINMSRVQLCIVNKQEDEIKYNKQYLINDANDIVDYPRLEAQLVVEKIYEIQRNYQKANKEFSFDKICILCRNKTSKEYIAISEELVKHNIPVANVINEKLYDNIDILMLVNFLRLIYMPKDDIALSSCLASPFINITFDELYKLKKESNNNLYDIITNYGQDDVIKNKINKLLTLIDNLKEFNYYHNLYQTLNYLDKKIKFRQYFLSLPDGQKRLNIINKFVDSFLSAQYNNSIEKYLYYVDNFANNEAFKFVNNLQADSVFLGTMHSSKGLDFENVIVAGLGNTFDFKMSQKREIALSKNLGLGAKAFDEISLKSTPTIVKEAIKRQTKEREFAEELRLLYVALTRAKERLIMVGTLKNKPVPIIDDYDIFSNNNALSLIIAGLDLDNYVVNKNNIDVQYYTKDEILSSRTQKINPIKLNKEAKKLQEKYHKPQIAFKNSVSELYEDEQDNYVSYNTQPKLLAVNEGTVLATTLGTYYHNIMQFIDFDKNIDEQIANYDNQAIQNISINMQKIKQAVDVIKSFEYNQIIKEQKFIAKLKYNEIFANSKIEDKIIVQGVADILIVGKENILIDYKTSNLKNDKDYQKKYGLQLKIYKIALQKALNIKIDKCFIYSFTLNRLISLQI